MSTRYARQASRWRWSVAGAMSCSGLYLVPGPAGVRALVCAHRLDAARSQALPRYDRCPVATVWLRRLSAADPLAKLPAMLESGGDMLALYQLAYALFLPEFQRELLGGALNRRSPMACRRASARSYAPRSRALTAPCHQRAGRAGVPRRASAAGY